MGTSETTSTETSVEAKGQAEATTGQAATADDFKSPESKQAVLADLKKEREARQALAAQLDEFKSAQAKQTQALAEAFGIQGEPKTEDLAETVKGLQAQIAASELEAARLRIAAEHKIPADYHDLLTETDLEKLSAQAAKVGALVAAQASDKRPEYLSNPGQGRGEGSSGGDAALVALDQQIAEASSKGDVMASIALKQQRAAHISQSKK